MQDDRKEAKVENMLQTTQTQAQQYRKEGIDQTILDIIRQVPRDKFVGDYGNHPMTIGYGQVILELFMDTFKTDVILALVKRCQAKCCCYRWTNSILSICSIYWDWIKGDKRIHRT